MPFYLTTAARTDVKSCTEHKPFAWMSNDGAHILSLHRRRDLVKGPAEPTILVTSAEARQIKAARKRADGLVRLSVTHEGKTETKEVKRDRISAAPVAKIVTGEHRWCCGSATQEPSPWEPYYRIAFFTDADHAQGQSEWELRLDNDKFYRNLAITIVPAQIKEI